MIPFTPQKVVIYGVGLLGGSFGLALRQAGFTGKIVGLSSPKALDEAIKIGCIDEGFAYTELAAAVTGADLLLLCTPIHSILDAIKELAKIQLPVNLIISDVGSTKCAISQRATSLLPTASFLGGHPMAGSEKSGVGASDPYLFQNARYVLTPQSGTLSEKEEGFSAFLTHHLGCRISVSTPETHDEMVATISHMPHILAVALMSTALDKEQSYPDTFSLAAGAFKDMTRIAVSGYPMWHDIFDTNRGPVTERLDAVIAKLTEMRNALAEERGLEEYFKTAGLRRKAMTFAGKGFSAPLHEIIVAAPDRPGALSAIANRLHYLAINIKDIELQKIREGEAGSIRLGFATKEIADAAVKALADIGFSSRR